MTWSGMHPAVAQWRVGVWLRLARHWFVDGDYAAARRFAGRALVIAGRHHQLGELRLEALELVAGAEQALGDYDRSGLLRHLALALVDTAQPSVPPLVRVLVGLADVKRVLGAYDTAESLLSRAAALACELDDPITRAGVHNGLGILYKELGRFGEAAGQYRMAAEHHASTPGHPPLAASLQHNLAGLAYARQDFIRAIGHARQAVQLREQAYGAAHPDVGRDLAVLAAAKAGLGHPAEAEALLRRALDIFRQRLGSDHYEVAVTLNSLAALRQDAHDFTGAEEMQRRALSLKARTLGARHCEVACLLNNLAVSLHEQGRDTEAREAYESALSIFEDTLAPTHPSVVACRANYARLVPLPGALRL